MLGGEGDIYPVIEEQLKDEWVRGGRVGSSAAEPPHSRDCSYMNLLRAGGGRGGVGETQAEKIRCEEIYVSSPLT
jgi:hypothetical protein